MPGLMPVSFTILALFFSIGTRYECIELSSENFEGSAFCRTLSMNREAFFSLTGSLLVDRPPACKIF
jgi:hypothetical protein